MKFLQKIIDVIKIATNEPLTVRTSKIVAGQEPEKTNQLLQLIGTVIENKLDWKTAVETVSSPKTKSKPKEKDVREKKSIEKPSPKVGGIKKTDSSKLETKEKIKSKEVKEKTLKKSSKPTDVDKKDEKRTKIKSSSKDQIKKTSPDKVKKSPSKLEHESKSALKSDDIKKPKSEPYTDKETATKDDESVLKNDKNEKLADISPETSSPSNQLKRNERRASKRAEEILLAAAAEDTNTNTESRRSSGGKRSSARSRKSSAENSRSGKPEDGNGKIPTESIESLKSVAEEPLSDDVTSSVLKSLPSQNPIQNVEIQRESTFVRENSKESTHNPPRPRTSLRPPSARPASARPGAPRRRDKNVEIILQPNDQVKLSTINVKLESFNSELEDDGENLVIIENPNTEDQLPGIASSDNRIGEDDTLQQGHLVQQILETQKELVLGGSAETESKENDISKLNSRQSSARQMNSLRDVIQNLTKSVNPLGKLMDFIPEDIDAMQLELTMWRDTYNQSSVELKKERSLTESVTEPMKNQLITIESTIKEYSEMIDACRVKILTNAEKIQRLLTTQ